MLPGSTQSPLVALIGIGCAASMQSVSFAATPPDIPTAPSAAELGQLVHGDGTYSLVLPDGAKLTKGDTRQSGFVTWKYAGQARFAVDPEPFSQERQLVGQGEPAFESDLELLFRSVKTDANGSVWSVADVDEDAWRQYVVQYGEDHPEEEDRPVDNVVCQDENVPVGVAYTFEPQMWSVTGNCTGGVTNRTWEGEDRSAIGTGHLAQECGAVTIFNTVTGGRCSGVLVEDSHVLTAAHCVANSSSNAVPVTQIQVCRDVSPVCVSGAFSINSIFVPTSYGGGTATCCGTDFGDDWAIIKLGFPLMPAADTLALSQASNSTITNLTRTRSFGNPGFVPACTPNGVMNRLTEVQAPSSTTNKKVRHKADNVAGQSGSPFYYCPAGDDSFCSSSEAGFVYGVFSGFNSFNMRVVGPKVPNFRSTALAFMATSPQ